MAAPTKKTKFPIEDVENGGQRDMHPTQECAGCFNIKTCGFMVPYGSASAVLTYSHGRGWELELAQAVAA